jgi:small subunit ribosomal protein S13
MLYIFNKTISNLKSIQNALTILYGINKYQSLKICKNIGINPLIKINKLKKSQLNRLLNYINKNILIEELLKKKKKEKKNFLLEIKHNKALRLKQKLPVKGQRTHSNAKTVKKIL